MRALPALLGLLPTDLLLLVLALATALTCGCARAPEPGPDEVAPGPCLEPGELVSIVARCRRAGEDTAEACAALEYAAAEVAAWKNKPAWRSDCHARVADTAAVLCHIDLDAAEALAAAVGPEHVPYAATVCALEMARSDLPSALAMLDRVRALSSVGLTADVSRALRPVLRELATDDLEAAFAVAERLKAPSPARIIAPIVLREVPWRFGEIVDLLPESLSENLRQEALQEVGRALVEVLETGQDPVIPLVDDLRDHNYIVGGMAHAVAERDPEMARKLVFSIADPKVRDKVRTEVTMLLWHTDPQGTTEYLRQLSSDRSRRRAMEPVIGDVFARDPDLGEEWLNMIQSEDERETALRRFVWHIAPAAPIRVLEIIRASGSLGMDYQLYPLIPSLAEKDADRALGAVAEIGKDELRSKAMAKVVLALAESDFNRAVTLLDKIEDERERENTRAALGAILVLEDGPRAAALIRASQHALGRRDGLRACAEKLCEADVEAALVFLQPFAQEWEAGEAQMVVAEALAHTDAARARDYARDITDARDRVEALLRVAEVLLPGEFGPDRPIAPD